MIARQSRTLIEMPKNLLEKKEKKFTVDRLKKVKGKS